MSDWFGFSICENSSIPVGNAFLCGCYSKSPDIQGSVQVQYTQQTGLGAARNRGGRKPHPLRRFGARIGAARIIEYFRSNIPVIA
jgi:hypothetical protein